jgi:hypothetical protein
VNGNERGKGWFLSSVENLRKQYASAGKKQRGRGCFSLLIVDEAW